MADKITLATLNTDLYRQAHSQDMTLSMYLESLNPTTEGGNLDAFERLMKEAGILTKNIPAKNIFSSKVEAFYRTDANKILFPEYIARTLVQAMVEYPIFKYLVAARTMIDSNVYKAGYLDLDDPKNKKATEMRRVTEAADLPVAKLKLGETAINIYKYGRAIEASYEALRRMSLEVFNIHLQEIGVQAADNKIAEILTIIKDGDGNSNAATKYKSSDLDSTATTALSREALIRFLLKFYPRNCNTIVSDEDGLIQLLEVLYPASSSAALMDELIAKGLNISVALPQGLVSNLTLLYSPHIEKISTKTPLYGLNRESAIEEIVEVGSTINEVDKFIKNQTELMTISENSGFRKILKKSSAIMTIE
jgi:hypothetical protein